MVKRGAPAGGLRVAIKAGGCSGYSYVFSGSRRRRPPTRCSTGPSGVKVFVDPRSLRLLDGTVLDFDEGNLMATNFTLRNPQRQERVRVRHLVFAPSGLAARG